MCPSYTSRLSQFWAGSFQLSTFKPHKYAKMPVHRFHKICCESFKFQYLQDEREFYSLTVEIN